LDEIRQQRIFFDFNQGILVCDLCLNPPVTYGTRVSKGTLKQLSWINNSDIKRADRIKFSTQAIKEGETLLELFIPCHIGREMKSLRFLKRIRYTL